MPTWTAEDARALLRAPVASDDKYSRGVLGVFTGSAEYPGAAVLSVQAAAHTGLGMIRYRGSAANAVLAQRPEAVTAPGRVDAWLLGSGISQLAVTEPVLSEALAADVPLVLDAGALSVEVLGMPAAGPRILTPHAGEAARLLGWSRTDVLDRPVAALEQLVQSHTATVLLKGNTTRVLSPQGTLIEVGPSTPWLATAGSGDVLGGILGALSASTPSADPAALAATAGWLHQAAAEHASAGGPIVALDIALALPQVIRTLLQ